MLAYDPFNRPKLTKREVAIYGEIEALKIQAAQLITIHGVNPKDPKIADIIKHIEDKLDELERVGAN